MKHVTLQVRPRVWPTSSPAPLLDARRLNEIMAAHSVRDAFTICAIVDGELRRHGYYRALPGGCTWNAAQDRVVSDVVGLDLDLCEIGAQIEEARWEHGG